ncbi:hypothetical protein T439DRAFT_353119 [Meredithblackwellia eburnea MCA 4105]
MNFNNNIHLTSIIEKAQDKHYHMMCSKFSPANTDSDVSSIDPSSESELDSALTSSSSSSDGEGGLKFKWVFSKKKRHVKSFKSFRLTEEEERVFICDRIIDWVYREIKLKVAHRGADFDLAFPPHQDLCELWSIDDSVLHEQVRTLAQEALAPWCREGQHLLWLCMKLSSHSNSGFKSIRNGSVTWNDVGGRARGRFAEWAAGRLWDDEGGFFFRRAAASRRSEREVRKLVELASR